MIHKEKTEMATDAQTEHFQKELDRYRTALEEIVKGMGPYSRDPLEHAGNTIEAMKQLAADALRK